MNAGIYIHIPFCRRKCDYCSFYSIPTEGLPGKMKAGIPDDYVRALVSEIRERSKELKTHIFDTIYFGGGTPSMISPDQLVLIMDALYENIAFLRNDMEVTIECNPEDLASGKIQGFREAGVNRAVLGVQTMDRESHAMIGRSGPVCTMELLDAFMGISGIIHCIDIITGIPGQTPRGVHEELDVIARMKPGHISAYMLSIDKGTRLHERYLPDDTFPAFQRALFTEVIHVLRAAGYEHYEVSNFALSGCISRHNMKYWTYQQYAGFGPGAHSFIDGKRFANASSVDDYIALNNRVVHDVRNRHDDIVEYIMTGMRLAWGVSEARFCRDTGRKFPDELRGAFARMAVSGHVKILATADDTRYSFTEEGLFLMDMLLPVLLDDYIHSDRER